MKIEVKLYKTKNEKVPAVDQVTLADKLVLRLFVKMGSKGPFVSPPSNQRKKNGEAVKDEKTGKDIWDDQWFPITKEFREELFSAIMTEYKTLAGADASPAHSSQPDDEKIPF